MAWKERILSELFLAWLPVHHPKGNYTYEMDERRHRLTSSTSQSSNQDIMLDLGQMHVILGTPVVKLKSKLRKVQ